MFELLYVKEAGINKYLYLYKDRIFHCGETLHVINQKWLFRSLNWEANSDIGLDWFLNYPYGELMGSHYSKIQSLWILLLGKELQAITIAP